MATPRLHRIGIDDALARLAQFDAVVDARSPAEHALDHLPGALNWPVLDDEERRLVGTEYTQLSAFEARKRGAAMAARNIARHLEREGASLGPEWKPLVYCWRGGQRSGSLALVLAQVGFEVQVLEGGYRAFRRRVLADLEDAGAGLDFRVLCGRTGTGKSRLLRALASHGAQVLDLEALAEHRGSVLGAVPDRSQPTQKAFETRLWHALRGFDPTRAVFVESESRTIGRLRLPDALLQRMRAAPCLHLEMGLPARVALLREDYAHYVADTAALCERLDTLREARGHACVAGWQALAREGRIDALVTALLESHYDPVYLRSMARNYQRFGHALELPVADGSPEALDRAAAAVIQLSHA
ncbi:MAG: tRNA 2-selenouridine(34) synthase MnmH [Rubrivivax sp.]